MDNDNTEQNSNNESGVLVREPDVYSSYPSGNRQVHDFSDSDESPETDTSSRIGNDSSEYSLGVDLGTDSQSKPADSRYSLGVDTSLSGGSKSQADRTETESSSRSNLSRSESWTSRFSLGIETDSTTSSRYSLGLNESLGISSESTSSRFSLGIFEPPSPSFPLRTGEKTSNGDKPAEKLPATPRDSQTTTKSRQQPSSKAGNPQQLQPSEKSWVGESLDWLKSKATWTTSELKNWVEKIEKFIGSNPEKLSVGSHLEKLSQSIAINKPDPNVLRETALASAQANKKDCADSTYDTATNLGHTDLPGKETNADKQIEHLRSNWRSVTQDEAIQLANQGILVIANMTSKELKDTYGHTAIVAPGGGIEHPPRSGKYYPKLIGGAKREGASSVLSPHKQPDGTISVRRAFPSKAVDKNLVDYRTPN
jgi:hypothetical protein